MEGEGLYETVWSDGATLYFGELAYQNARLLFDKMAASKTVLGKGEEREGEGEGKKKEKIGEEVVEVKEENKEEGLKEENETHFDIDLNRKRKLDDVTELKHVGVDRVAVCEVEVEGEEEGVDIMDEGSDGINGVLHEVVNEVEVEVGGVEKKARMNSQIEIVTKVGVEVGVTPAISMTDADNDEDEDEDIDEDAHLRSVADSVPMIISHDTDDDEIEVDARIGAGEGGDGEEGEDGEGEGEEGEEGEGEGEDGEEGDINIQDSVDVTVPHLGSHPNPNPIPNPITGAAPLLMRSKYSVPYETVLKWR